ncbi:hypothetical protein M378DRAFT_12817 [Amanita muscaria Koide BX008]|uniref:1-alkyl-2-acetylglycerophosphocholine esterase n=1 Tax=Amanita muscaria (strain Koide BX008) TaxID=946122 RepID=A0A0C2X1C1_AMAMK|nr:hypothetical protein M378DRAFT_12817 [Amanita muscaria Koide BX008]
MFYSMYQLSTLAILLLVVVPTSLFRYVKAIQTPLTERGDPPLGIHHLPAPTGPYTIGTTNLILTDQTRLEIFSPTPNTTARTIVGQIYYPTLPADQLNKSGSYTLSPYLTPGIARWLENGYGFPSHAVDGILTNTYLDASVSLPRGKDPANVVVFSPGYGLSRSFYATYHEQLASKGYVVVAIEHLYDVDYVDIPGLGVFQNPYVNASAEDSAAIIDEMHAVRVQDALFILRSLADPQSQLVTGVENLIANGGSGYDKDTWWSKNARVAMYGHSLGGSTSAGAMLVDNTSVKLLGGINLDGMFVGPAMLVDNTSVKPLGGINLDGMFVDPAINPPATPYNYLDSPFLLFGHQGHNRTSDSTWTFFYDNVLRGWKRELALLDAQHLTFSDFPAIADLLGLRNVLPPAVVDGFVGTIPGLGAVQVVREFVGAFMDWVVRRDESGEKLLDGVGKEKWPEVQYLW